MTTYFMDEASFDLPDLGFIDKTETVLGFGNVEVRIERSKAPNDLESFVTERLDGATKRLRGCSLVFRRAVEIGREPALEAGLRYRGQSGMVCRREVYLVRHTTLFIVSATARIDEWEAVDAAIEAVTSTLEVRGAR